MENAQITRDIINGVGGARREAVLLNGGAGLYLAGKADSLTDGVFLAARLIDSGKAGTKLEELIRESNRQEKAV
jgi:anthranilate phosphoribosyltransferase